MGDEPRTPDPGVQQRQAAPVDLRRLADSTIAGLGVLYGEVRSAAQCTPDPARAEVLVARVLFERDRLLERWRDASQRDLTPLMYGMSDMIDAEIRHGLPAPKRRPRSALH